ncbi:hypothetical protein G9444_1367 [Rhodococcus erythropolis]|uniref:Uncharacterized protein n=1 Tax=Rhodococcus erythropolis TaxID=1833 RepID=A0A6G9CPN8_RHOER|nr:hypothetical protein G9444_1367 [Rhodococcus erythropolis]
MRFRLWVDEKQPDRGVRSGFCSTTPGYAPKPRPRFRLFTLGGELPMLTGVSVNPVPWSTT